MKFSFAVSLVLFVVAIVATSVLYLALDAMGVFDSVNKALAEMIGQAGEAAERLQDHSQGRHRRRRCCSARSTWCSSPRW